MSYNEPLRMLDSFYSHTFHSSLSDREINVTLMSINLIGIHYDVTLYSGGHKFPPKSHFAELFLSRKPSSQRVA